MRACARNGPQRVPGAQGQRQWLAERAEPAVAHPARRAAAVGGGAGRVGHGQSAPEPLGRLRGGRRGREQGQVEVVGPLVEHLDHRGATLADGLAEPPQAARLPREVARRHGRRLLAVTGRHPAIVAGRPRCGGPEWILGRHLTAGEDR